MPTLAEIVRNNSLIEEDDLKELFSKRLEVQSQAWVLQVGLILGIFGPIVILTIGLIIQPANLTILYSIVILLLFQGALVWTLRSSIQKDSPSVRHANALKDYLEARKILRDRAKVSAHSLVK